VEVEAEDIVRFPEGLLGLPECREWVFLADTWSEAVAWMQSVDRPEIALAVVNPRRFLASYRVHVSRRELEPLRLPHPAAAEVLAIVSKTDRVLTLNLRAPLVVNLDRRLGRQVVANDELPVRHELSALPSPWKKTA